MLCAKTVNLHSFFRSISQHGLMCVGWIDVNIHHQIFPFYTSILNIRCKFWRSFRSTPKSIYDSLTGPKIFPFANLLPQRDWRHLHYFNSLHLSTTNIAIYNMAETFWWKFHKGGPNIFSLHVLADKLDLNHINSKLSIPKANENICL